MGVSLSVLGLLKQFVCVCVCICRYVNMYSFLMKASVMLGWMFQSKYETGETQW